MVSPSKYCKTPKRDFKIGIERLKKDRVKVQIASKLSNSKNSLASGSTSYCRPLVNKKCYLDIRNKAELSRLETTLRACGATVEVFLGKDVDIVVTDRTEWSGKGESPAASMSPATNPSPSNHLEQRFYVPKTRASAMIEKVSTHSTLPFYGPLELAQKWKIPILSVQSIWKWIAKVRDSVINKLNAKKIKGKKTNQAQVKDARASFFIKIESLISPNKPELQVLDDWPKLNLEGHLGQCPFRSPSPINLARSERGYETRNELLKTPEPKDRVAVELIEYDTSAFRVQNADEWKYEQEQRNQTSLTKRSNIPVLSEVRGSSKMTRRPVKYNVNHEEDPGNTTCAKQISLSPCNGYQNRSVTRQSSQELLKVQCNGLTSGHRSSKLLSPSGSDVLPLPSSKRCTRRASASWCGSTRELSQLSPTDSEIENIRREINFETHDPILDSPGITLRPKGQLWLPVALIGTTAEENGNNIRKRCDSLKYSENVNELTVSGCGGACCVGGGRTKFATSCKVLKGNESCLNELLGRRDSDQREEAFFIGTRNSKMKTEDVINEKTRETSADSRQSSEECAGRIMPRNNSCNSSVPSSAKRSRTLSANSLCSIGKKKKLSPEEKLLQDNKDYFKMEVLNTKLRSSGSLLNLNQSKEPEKIHKIIIKKIKGRGRKRKDAWTKTEEKEISDRKNKSCLKPNGIIRKKRQSELMTLCDEAESFMFGESSRQGTPASATARKPESEADKKKAAYPSGRRTFLREESSTDDGSSSAPVQGFPGKNTRRKKRRSHAEAFIHDNLDYYKFETPGSRLRHQTNPKSDTDKDKSSTELEIKKEPSTEAEAESESERDGKKRNFCQISDEVNNLIFSFEKIPATEPWYDVYKRQDEGTENYYPLLSDPNDEPFLLPYELPKPFFPKVPDASDYYKRRRKKLARILSNHPRKSPRCHASTLAILSSLKKRKRRSGTNLSTLGGHVAASASDPCPPVSSTRAAGPGERRNFGPEPDTKVHDEIPDPLSFLPKEEIESGEEDGDGNGMILEPSSDSESKPKGKIFEDDDAKSSSRTRNRKVTRSESHGDSGDETKNCALRFVKPENFFGGMMIETRKKSLLNVDMLSVLNNFGSGNFLSDIDADLISDAEMSTATEESNARRRRRKARKINKTGWDNKKTKRKPANKISQTKVKSENKSKRLKTKVKIKENYSHSEDVGVTNKRLRKLDARKSCDSIPDDRPKSRSRDQLLDRTCFSRRKSQESDKAHSRSESLDSTSLEYSPCVVRVKKINELPLNASVKLRCANGRYSIQSKRIVLSRKKRRVMDYAWTTKKR